ncbi:MAG: MarR family transcriptional regulator [Massilia sp.]|nr:MarR family transcriptional regulator [Massilia sp.]
MSEAPDSLSLVRAISEASRNLSSLFDSHLRSVGLTAARGRVLLFLARQAEPVRQRQITEFMRVENPTTVGILDGLEALGYIRRLPDPHDRRAKLVELTAEGKPRANDVMQVTHRLNRLILQGMTADEIKCAEGVVSKILDNITRAPAVADHLTRGDEVPA